MTHSIITPGHTIYGPDWRSRTARRRADRPCDDESEDDEGDDREEECQEGYFDLRTGEYHGPSDDRFLLDPYEEDAVVTAITCTFQHELSGEPIDHLNPEWVTAFRTAQAVAQEPSARLTIEAMVLANCDISIIADKAGIAPTHVLEYERCFFDVRSYLRYCDFISGQIGRSSEPDDSLRKSVLEYSYHGGPHATVHCLDNLEFIAKGIEHDLTTPEGRDREHISLLLLQRTVDVYQVPPALLAELSQLGQVTRLPPTVSELVSDQVSRTIHRIGTECSTTPHVGLLEPFRYRCSVGQTA